jgi:hypothetical protein
MGYDLKMVDALAAELSYGFDIYFSAESVTVNGMSRLHRAIGTDGDLLRRMTINDGHRVTPVECHMMATRLEQALEKGAPEVEVRPEFFREFAEFCRNAAKCEGFEVW